MPESQKHPSEFIQRLAGHIKDAFLHTEIPDDDDSRIPSDRSFQDMARYLSDSQELEITIHQPFTGRLP